MSSSSLDYLWITLNPNIILCLYLQVVYLKKSPDSNTHFQKPTSITIQKCSNITIGAGAFSTLGPVVNVIISDVRYVEIQQNAFDLGKYFYNK